MQWSQAMSSPHFNSQTPGCQIHTTREGTCSKAPCNHVTNAQRAPGAVAHAFSPWQSHHILCIRSVVAFQSLPAYDSCVKEINDSYLRTDWCIHQPPNLLPLPMKSTYKNAAARALNLPCHDMHHNCKQGYFDE